jgi:hypothetical protein
MGGPCQLEDFLALTRQAELLFRQESLEAA